MGIGQLHLCTPIKAKICNKHRALLKLDSMKLHANIDCLWTVAIYFYNNIYESKRYSIPRR